MRASCRTAIVSGPGIALSALFCDRHQNEKTKKNPFKRYTVVGNCKTRRRGRVTDCASSSLVDSAAPRAAVDDGRLRRREQTNEPSTAAAAAATPHTHTFFFSASRNTLYKSKNYSTVCRATLLRSRGHYIIARIHELLSLRYYNSTLTYIYAHA